MFTVKSYHECNCVGFEVEVTYFTHIVQVSLVPGHTGQKRKDKTILTLNNW